MFASKPFKAIKLTSTLLKQSSSSYSTLKDVRVRRALFSVPGADERKISKAASVQPDSVVLDLEDGVAHDKKEDARKMVLHSLNTINFGRSEVAVRINAVRSGMAVKDLLSVLQSSSLQAIVIPKVEFASDVRFVNEFVDAYASDTVKQNVRFLAAVESALGLINLKEIASSCARLDALIFASEDLCADMGMTRTPGARELLFARSCIVTHAVAHGLQAIDMVCMDYKNEAVLAKECQEGFEMGFTGKQAIHPGQLPTINKLFRPSDAELKKAMRIVEGYKEHTSKGVGAFNLDGFVIDLPVVKWAEKVLLRDKLTKNEK